MEFEIVFHGPMRVATGTAAPGADATVDPDALLPAASLKGLMRDTARQLFADDDVAAVFGGGGQPSPWSWCSARFEPEAPPVTRRARIRRDERGVTDRGALLVQEEVWPERATFEIEQVLPVPREGLERQRLVLTAAAHAVHALGADRRRGLGWVGVARTDASPDDIARAVELALEALNEGGVR